MDLIKTRNKLFKELKELGHFVDGSLVTIARKCGTPNCKCTKGEKHKSFFLTYKPPRRIPCEKSKTKTLYIPVTMEKEVRQWTDEHAKYKYLMKEISKIQKEIIRTHVYERDKKLKKDKTDD